MDSSVTNGSAGAERPRRSAAFDCLRAVACLCIILMHTARSTQLMYGMKMTSFARAAVCQIALNLQYWAVPCFIMVTGALLLQPEKQIGYRRLFSRYIARVLKAIVVFGVLFAVLEAIFNPEMRTWSAFLGGCWEVFTGGTWSHMWYLYCLLGLYLLLPAYKKIAAMSEERDIRYLLIVCGVFLSLVPLLGLLHISCGFYIHVGTIYPFWLFLGYYLYRWGDRLPRRVYGAMALLGTAALGLLTWARMRWGLPALDGLFASDGSFMAAYNFRDGYSFVLVILQAAGLAGWFFRCGQEGAAGVKKVLANIDRHSFGIYLIHMAYVRLLYKYLHFDPYALGMAGVPGILAVVLFAFVMAYITDMGMKKLPVFKGIV